MQIADLGEIEGDIFVFGGAVSNLQALDALVSAVGAGTAISTGDLVAYCASPEQVVERIRALGWPGIAGNCERQIGAGAGGCGCGFGEGTTCDLLSARWYRHASEGVTDGDRAWMRSLPDCLTFRAHGKRWAVLHGGATANNRFLWPVSPDSDFSEEIGALESEIGRVDAVLAGHCGFPFRRRIGPVEWINAGSIGMPPHYGNRETHYATLGPEGLRLLVLAYDAEAAATAMIRAGLTQGYERTLLSGWWPSEEILPESLRRVS